MKWFTKAQRRAAAGGLCLAAMLSGCAGPKPGVFYQPPRPFPVLGSQAVDPIFTIQEENADANDFVFHIHEFKVDGVRLNYAGEDHVKQVAAQLQTGSPYPVVVQRSFNSKRAGKHKYNYPVHPNPEMDNKRREVIVRALTRLGVEDADRRVVVAPAFAHEFTDPEAERTYNAFMQGGRGNGFGFGGFGGGFGGGGFGGFGGGF